MIEPRDRAKLKIPRKIPIVGQSTPSQGPWNNSTAREIPSMATMIWAIGDADHVQPFTDAMPQTTATPMWRARFGTTNHPGAQSATRRPYQAIPQRSLSLSGSSQTPISLSARSARATRPSKRSVNAAAMKIQNPAKRVAGSNMHHKTTKPASPRLAVMRFGIQERMARP